MGQHSCTPMCVQTDPGETEQKRNAKPTSQEEKQALNQNSEAHIPQHTVCYPTERNKDTRLQQQKNVAEPGVQAGHCTYSER